MGQALRKVEAVAAGRSQARERLAEVVGRVSSLRDRLGKIRKGLAENERWSLLAAKDQAQEVLDKAREAETERETAKILGDPEPAGPSVAEAERALAKASEDYERIARVATVLEQSERQAASDIGFAEGRLRDAIGAVVQSEPAVRALLQRYEATLREASRLRLTIQTFSRFFPRELAGWDARHEFRDVHADPAWSAWIAALETDADALAPEV